MLKGIDVCGFNGNIDWEKVKADNVKFAILKLGNIYDTDKNYVDSKFEINYKKCIELGIAVGVYIYNYCNSTDTLKKGTEWAIKQLNKRNLQLPVYLDMEDKTIVCEGKTALTNQCVEFCKIVEDAGYKSGVYANVNWFKNYIDASKLDCSIWVAQYYSKCEYTGKYDIWQNSSDGSINGISGRVDTDCLYNEEIIKKMDSTSSNKQETINNTSSSKTVLEWQKIMNKVYNCGLAEDNSYGPDSKVKANKFYLYYKTPTIVNDHVKFIQERLISKGFSCGSYGADGSYGSATESAVKAFQKANGLKVDGWVGAKTTELLLK